jgi:hypothetical protein
MQLLEPQSEEYKPHDFAAKLDIDKYTLPKPPKMPKLHTGNSMKMSMIQSAVELGIESALIELGETAS